MGAEKSKLKAVEADEFVRIKLTECNCESVLQVFAGMFIYLLCRL